PSTAKAEEIVSAWQGHWRGLPCPTVAAPYLGSNQGFALPARVAPGFPAFAGSRHLSAVACETKSTGTVPAHPPLGLLSAQSDRLYFRSDSPWIGMELSAGSVALVFRQKRRTSLRGRVEKERWNCCNNFFEGLCRSHNVRRRPSPRPCSATSLREFSRRQPLVLKLWRS